MASVMSGNKADAPSSDQGAAGFEDIYRRRLLKQFAELEVPSLDSKRVASESDSAVDDGVWGMQFDVGHFKDG